MLFKGVAIIAVAALILFRSIIIFNIVVRFMCGYMVGRVKQGDYMAWHVTNRFIEGLYYVDDFPKDEDEVNKMLELLKQENPDRYETRFKWNLKYRLIEKKKDNEVIFLLVVDTSKNFSFVTYEGFVVTCIGIAKKNEKGEWQARMEFIYQLSYVQNYGENNSNIEKENGESQF